MKVLRYSKNYSANCSNRCCSWTASAPAAIGVSASGAHGYPPSTSLISGGEVG
jgi:hypothetical protein